MTSGAEADGTTQGSFDCTVKELKELMSYRKEEASDKIKEDYHSVLEICRRLQTSPTEGIL